MNMLQKLLFASAFIACGQNHKTTSTTQDQVIMGENGENFVVFQNYEDKLIYIAKCSTEDLVKLEMLYEGYENMEPRAQFGTWIISQKNPCHIAMRSSKALSKDSYLSEVYRLLEIGQNGEQKILDKINQVIKELQQQIQNNNSNESLLLQQIKDNGKRIEELRLLITSKKSENEEILKVVKFLQDKISENPTINQDQLEILKKQLENNLKQSQNLNTEAENLSKQIDALSATNERDLSIKLANIKNNIASLQVKIDAADDRRDEDFARLADMRKLFEIALEPGKFNLSSTSPQLLKRIYTSVFSVTETKCINLNENKNINIIDPTPKEIVFESKSSIEINDFNSVSTEIKIDKNVAYESASLFIDMQHTAGGDLKITLDHPTGSINLAQSGNINTGINFPLNMGLKTLGTWKLTIQDTQARDVGILKGWKLKFNSKSNHSETFAAAIPSGTSLAINQNSNPGLVSEIRVNASTTQKITKNFSVWIGLRHRFAHNLNLTLISPTNKKIEILAPTNSENLLNLDKTIKIPLEKLQSIIGDSIDGTWKLSINDVKSSAKGELYGWSITNEVVPDNIPENSTGIISTISITQKEGLISDNMEINLKLDHLKHSDLKVTLIAPNGLRQILFLNEPTIPEKIIMKNYRFFSEFKDLPWNGNWTIEVVDLVAGNKGTLFSWGLVDQNCSI